MRYATARCYYDDFDVEGLGLPRFISRQTLSLVRQPLSSSQFQRTAEYWVRAMKLSNNITVKTAFTLKRAGELFKPQTKTSCLHFAIKAYNRHD